MMSDAPAKGGNLYNLITHIWAEQKTESSVYHWLRALAMFDVTCYPAFVGALDIISCVQLKRLLGLKINKYFCIRPSYIPVYRIGF